MKIKGLYRVLLLAAGVVVLLGCAGPERSAMFSRLDAASGGLETNIITLPQGAAGQHGLEQGAVTSQAPGQIELVGQLGGQFSSVAVQGTAEEAGRRMVDLAPQTVEDILVVGEQTAYVAAGAGGLWVYDLTVAAQPVLIGRTDLAGSASGLAQAGAYLYVAAGEAGFYVLDMANANAPAVIGVYETAGDASDVAVAGSVVYVSDDQQGLAVVDVSNPARPVTVTTLTVGSVRDLKTEVALAGAAAQRLYVAADEEGLYVIDISDPYNPSVLDQYSAPGDANSVVVAGGYAYLAAGGAGLQVIDLTSPPSEGSEAVGAWTEGYGREIAIAGHYAYLASEEGGLHVFDIANPALPVKVGVFDTSGSVQRIYVANGHLYVADGAGGLVILQFTPG